jgi:hypothetical protein
MVRVEVPSLKVPTVTATLPEELTAAVVSVSVGVPAVWLKPTQLTVAAFRLTAAVPLKTIGPLRFTVPAALMV